MKRMLGIDFGKARIGVAVSDELGLLAHPVETILMAKTADPAQRIVAIAREKDAGRIVVGLPRHLNGRVGVSAEEANVFAEKLRALVPCEVITWDERLSTVGAHRALREAGKSSRQTRGYIDQVAAQILLQSYLDSLQLNSDNADAERLA